MREIGLNSLSWLVVVIASVSLQTAYGRPPLDPSENQTHPVVTTASEKFTGSPGLPALTTKAPVLNGEKDAIPRARPEGGRGGQDGGHGRPGRGGNKDGHRRFMGMICKVTNATSGQEFCHTNCSHGLVCRSPFPNHNKTESRDSGLNDGDARRRHHRRPRDIIISLCLPEICKEVVDAKVIVEQNCTANLTCREVFNRHNNSLSVCLPNRRHGRPNHNGPMDRRVDFFAEGEDHKEEDDSEEVFDVLYDADKAENLREEDLLPNDDDEAGADRPRNKSEKLEKMCGHFPRRHHHRRRGESMPSRGGARPQNRDESSEENDGPSDGEEAERSEEDLGYHSREYQRGGRPGGRREAGGREVGREGRFADDSSEGKARRGPRGEGRFDEDSTEDDFRRGPRREGRFDDDSTEDDFRRGPRREGRFDDDSTEDDLRRGPRREGRFDDDSSEHDFRRGPGREGRFDDDTSEHDFRRGPGREGRFDEDSSEHDFRRGPRREGRFDDDSSEDDFRRGPGREGRFDEDSSEHDFRRGPRREGRFDDDSSEDDFRRGPRREGRFDDDSSEDDFRRGPRREGRFDDDSSEDDFRRGPRREGRFDDDSSEDDFRRGPRREGRFDDDSTEDDFRRGPRREGRFDDDSTEDDFRRGPRREGRFDDDSSEDDFRRGPRREGRFDKDSSEGDFRRGPRGHPVATEEGRGGTSTRQSPWWVPRGRQSNMGPHRRAGKPHKGFPMRHPMAKGRRPHHFGPVPPTICRVVNTTSGANFCTMMCTHGLVCRQVTRPRNNTAFSDDVDDLDDDIFSDSQSSEISRRRHHRKPRDIAISLCLPQVCNKTVNGSVVEQHNCTGGQKCIEVFNRRNRTISLCLPPHRHHHRHHPHHRHHGRPHPGPHHGSGRRHPSHGPPHRGPPHRGPPHHGPPHRGPPHRGPPHHGPPHHGPPHHGPPHRGPPHHGPPHRGPPHHGPPHHGPPHRGPPHHGLGGLGIRGESEYGRDYRSDDILSNDDRIEDESVESYEDDWDSFEDRSKESYEDDSFEDETMESYEDDWDSEEDDDSFEDGNIDSYDDDDDDFEGLSMEFDGDDWSVELPEDEERGHKPERPWYQRMCGHVLPHIRRHHRRGHGHGGCPHHHGHYPRHHGRGGKPMRGKPMRGGFAHEDRDEEEMFGKGMSSGSRRIPRELNHRPPMEGHQRGGRGGRDLREERPMGKPFDRRGGPVREQGPVGRWGHGHPKDGEQPGEHRGPFMRDGPVPRGGKRGHPIGKHGMPGEDRPRRTEAHKGMGPMEGRHMREGRPMGERHMKEGRPMGERHMREGRSMGDRHMREGMPMGERHMREGRPMGERHMGEGRPMGERHMREGRPMGERHIGEGRPMGERHMGEGRPMGERHMREGRPMGERHMRELISHLWPRDRPHQGGKLGPRGDHPMGHPMPQDAGRPEEGPRHGRGVGAEDRPGPGHRKEHGDTDRVHVNVDVEVRN